jgi:hypothetical protein
VNRRQDPQWMTARMSGCPARDNATSPSHRSPRAALPDRTKRNVSVANLAPVRFRGGLHSGEMRQFVNKLYRLGNRFGPAGRCDPKNRHNRSGRCLRPECAARGHEFESGSQGSAGRAGRKARSRGGWNKRARPGGIGNGKPGRGESGRIPLPALAFSHSVS